MSTSTPSSPPPDDDESFLSTILKPGSSLHPTFLLIVDGAFAFLFVVFIALAFMTAGNIHIFALMGIEIALWASIKWFVYELQNSPPITAETEESKKTS